MLSPTDQAQVIRLATQVAQHTPSIQTITKFDWLYALFALGGFMNLSAGLLIVWHIRWHRKQDESGLGYGIQV